jgi:osmotically-inducible protein OsmY
MSTAKSVWFTDCDKDVYLRVCSILQSRHFPAFRQLGVQVEQGIVTLTGQVCSYYEKQVAITTCQHVAGVRSLIDCIVVSDGKWSGTRPADRVAVVNE